MRIFVSYASEQSSRAEEIEYALAGEGHDVFRDERRLLPGRAFDGEIRQAVQESDLFVFLVSAESIAAGSYALTELKFAREKWSHAQDGVLPVLLDSTPMDELPAYLRAVTVMRPSGNVAAEVAAAVSDLSVRSPDRPGSGACTSADAFLWGCLGGWLSSCPLAETVKQRLRFDRALHDENALKRSIQLEEMDAALPPLEGRHASLSAWAERVGLRMPAEATVPSVDFDEDQEIADLGRSLEEDGEGDFGWEMDASLRIHFASVWEQIETYSRLVLSPTVRRVAAHSSGHRLALSTGASLVTLVLTPLHPGGLRHLPDFESYRSMGGWLFARGVGKLVGRQAEQIRENVEALGVDGAPVAQFEELSRDLLSSTRRAASTAASPGLEDPELATQVFWLMAGANGRFSDLMARFAAEMERSLPA